MTMVKILRTCIAMVLFFMISCTTTTKDSKIFNRTSTMWAPYLEWSLENRSYSENPFDIIAKVIFTHQSSKKEHITEMFYIGNNIWKFRFTGTAVGEWSYITRSDDPELDGKTGNIEINENYNPTIKGFLTHHKNQFAVWTGNEPVLSPYRFMVYMNGTHFSKSDIERWSKKSIFDDKLWKDDYHTNPLFTYREPARMQAFLDEADENGFNIVFKTYGHPFVWIDGKDQVNPRLEAFDELEKEIIHAHSQGKRMHIWMWGDNERKATPLLLEGGVNGLVDRRLQSYIAARLGPLPGWSMGYGFDLHEWTNQEKLNDWASYLHSHFGWDHLLSARGHVLKGKNNINSYDGFGREKAFLHTTRHGPVDYFEVLEDMTGDMTRPHLYEERHSYLRPEFNLDMDGSRRLMWWQMMAGGMGGWFGFYSSANNLPFKGSPYPNPEQFRTARQCWNRFALLNMKPKHIDNHYMLVSSNNQQMLIYVEDTDQVNLDLSKIFNGKESGIAIDTKKEYNEIILVRSNTDIEKQSWKAPYKSDWAIALGYH